jgi:hypothetical protein
MMHKSRQVKEGHKNRAVTLTYLTYMYIAIRMSREQLSINKRPYTVRRDCLLRLLFQERSAISHIPIVNGPLLTSHHTLGIHQASGRLGPFATFLNNHLVYVDSQSLPTRHTQRL